MIQSTYFGKGVTIGTVVARNGEEGDQVVGGSRTREFLE
jgi:hypothetical protein